MILLFFSICSLTLFLCLFRSNCPFFSSCSFHSPWEICFIYILCFQLLYVFRCCLSSLLFFYGVYMLAHTFLCAYTHVCVGHRITSGVPQELSHHVFKSQFLNRPELAHLARLTASPRDLPVSTFPVLGLSVHAIILAFFKYFNWLSYLPACFASFLNSTCTVAPRTFLLYMSLVTSIVISGGNALSSPCSLLFH